MTHLFLDSAWRVALWGLALGAGLPLLFAVGVRQTAGRSNEQEPSLAAKVAGGVCYLLVAFAVVSGLMIIVAAGIGKDVSFAHVFPTFTAKS